MNTKLIRLSITCLFLVLAVLFFSPVRIPYKVAYPVALLFLAGLGWQHRWMVVAMFCSALGDFMGALHNFPCQMGAFALAHCAFILYFLSLRRQVRTATVCFRLSLLVGVLLFMAFASCAILPAVHPLGLRVGVAVYILLILGMFYCASLQRDAWFMIGALLFVFSDTVLAWNKFVCHIPQARLWIMIPYYAAQLLLFMRASVRR